MPGMRPLIVAAVALACLLGVQFGESAEDTACTEKHEANQHACLAYGEHSPICTGAQAQYLMQCAHAPRPLFKASLGEAVQDHQSAKIGATASAHALGRPEYQPVPVAKMTYKDGREHKWEKDIPASCSGVPETSPACKLNDFIKGEDAGVRCVEKAGLKCQYSPLVVAVEEKCSGAGKPAVAAVAAVAEVQAVAHEPEKCTGIIPEVQHIPAVEVAHCGINEVDADENDCAVNATGDGCVAETGDCKFVAARAEVPHANAKPCEVEPGAGQCQSNPSVCTHVPEVVEVKHKPGVEAVPATPAIKCRVEQGSSCNLESPFCDYHPPVDAIQQTCSGDEGCELNPLVQEAMPGTQCAFEDPGCHFKPAGAETVVPAEQTLQEHMQPAIIECETEYDESKNQCHKNVAEAYKAWKDKDAEATEDKATALKRGQEADAEALQKKQEEESAQRTAEQQAAALAKTPLPAECECTLACQQGPSEKIPLCALNEEVTPAVLATCTGDGKPATAASPGLAAVEAANEVPPTCGTGADADLNPCAVNDDGTSCVVATGTCAFVAKVEAVTAKPVQVALPAIPHLDCSLNNDGTACAAEVGSYCTYNARIPEISRHSKCGLGLADGCVFKPERPRPKLDSPEAKVQAEIEDSDTTALVQPDRDLGDSVEVEQLYDEAMDKMHESQVGGLSGLFLSPVSAARRALGF